MKKHMTIRYFEHLYQVEQNPGGYYLVHFSDGRPCIYMTIEI